MILLAQNGLLTGLESGGQGFFRTIDDRWLADLRDFISGALPKIVVTLIVAWLFARLVKVITAHVVKVAERHSGGRRSISQVRTLTSVFRATGIGIIVFLATMEVLPLLGFKLEPLLASAGVAGVAIGLAAQTIVKDCLNGVLILVEDQYNVGDVVRLAGLSGTVEGMTLRRTLVRDSDGTLYVIPNSQITTVANLTRDFTVATVNVSVDFSADPDKVMALLKKVAMGLRNDPQYQDVFLGDTVLLGVDAIKGSQVIYPIQLRTRANKHAPVVRELQKRIRVALKENHMLPGDPLRVFGSRNGAALPGSTVDGGAVAVADPTAAKANEVNPFTGEGM
jgi:small conductance mechanosensitive channel